SDSLEHFDGNDLVELPGAVAVVLKPDLRLVGKTGLRQAFPCELSLLVRKRESGHPAARLGRRIFGKAAPAAADLGNMVVRAKIECFDDAGVFGPLRVGQ